MESDVGRNYDVLQISPKRFSRRLHDIVVAGYSWRFTSHEERVLEAGGVGRG